MSYATAARARAGEQPRSERAEHRERRDGVIKSVVGPPMMMRCLLPLVLALAMSCRESSKPTDAHAPATDPTSTDTQLLRRYINLAREPSSVQWKTSKLPGRSDWALMALFRYARADSAATHALDHPSSRSRERYADAV